MNGNIKALLIKGRFNEDDFRELLVFLRSIASRHPEDNYYATVYATVIDSDVNPTDPEINLSNSYRS